MKSNIITFLVICLISFVSCGKKADTHANEEDNKAKNTLQGIWINEDEGDPVLYFKGDTAYYPIGNGEPVYFFVSHDSIHFNSSRPSAYAIKVLTQNSFRFINSDGDEVRLSKSSNKSDISFFTKQKNDSITINQNTLIKRDTVITVNDVREHIYIQINPGHEKVLKQTINDDGVAIDNAFWDNSIHVAIFNGSKCIYRHDFVKEQFSKFVPADYLNQSILSDIAINKVTDDAVIMTATIAQPDNYSSYNISIAVNTSGKASMSLLQ